MKNLWIRKNGLISIVFIGLVLGAGILPNVIATEKTSVKPLWAELNNGNRDLLDVLVVMDSHIDTSSYYTSALDALGYSYDVFVWSSSWYWLTGQDLKDYVKAVIWVTYSETSGTLDVHARTLLGQYLDLGGKLFVSGCNIAEDLHNQGLDNWLRTYLGADFKNANEGFEQDYVYLNGDGIFSTLDQIGQANPGIHNCPDGIGPTNTPHYSYCGFHYIPPYTDGWMGAVYYPQVVFFAFGFEAIFYPDDHITQTLIMSKILNYLIPGENIDPDYSSVEFASDGLPCLFTCPAGDGIPKQIIVTVKNHNDDPIPGIPGGSIDVEMDTSGIEDGQLWLGVDRVDEETNENGEIRVDIYNDYSLIGNITLQVRVSGVLINDLDVLPCKSVDFNCDGYVNIGDFSTFARAYGHPAGWRCDFNGNGYVDLPDFYLFAQHYGHHG